MSENYTNYIINCENSLINLYAGVLNGPQNKRILGKYLYRQIIIARRTTLTPLA